jgi:hypothetical protein
MGGKPSFLSHANPLATAHKHISTSAGLLASGNKKRSGGKWRKIERTLLWTVSAGLKGSQFDRSEVSQQIAGLKAGHTTARDSGSKKRQSFGFWFSSSKESSAFSA